MTFYEYLLGLICFFRTETYSKKGRLQYKLAVARGNLVGKREDYDTLVSLMEKEDAVLDTLEDLQGAAIARGGVWAILRENPELLKDLIEAAGSEDWFASQYVRRLKQDDQDGEDIMAEGFAVLLDGAESILPANN